LKIFGERAPNRFFTSAELHTDQYINPPRLMRLKTASVCSV
jgi:hypothetical protein